MPCDRHCPIGRNNRADIRSSNSSSYIRRAPRRVGSFSCCRSVLSMRKRHRAAAGLMSFEAAAGQRQLRQYVAFVVADDQGAVLEGPFAAGEEVAGTAALGRDRALGGTWVVGEAHKARAAPGGRKPPAAGDIDR